MISCQSYKVKKATNQQVKLLHQPCSSGSDKPGILPARRPCLTTANPSPGNPNTADDAREIPETKIDRLLNIPQDSSFSLSTNPFPLEPGTAFAVEIPFSCEERAKLQEGAIC